MTVSPGASRRADECDASDEPVAKRARQQSTGERAWDAEAWAAARGFASFEAAMKRLAKPCTARAEVGLTAAEKAFFDETGYVVVRGALGSSDLDPLASEFCEKLDELCRRLHAAGRLKAAYAHLPFEERYLQVIKETGDVFIDMWRPTLPGKLETIRSDTEMHFGPETFRFLTNRRVLDCVESVLGGEIYSNPIQNVRIKPPDSIVNKRAEGVSQGLVGITPWHQDNAVCTKDADETPLVTVWAPMHDVDYANSPLIVVPRSHRKGLASHCVHAITRELTIPESTIDTTCQDLGYDKPLALEMQRGDILLLHSLCMHACKNNESPHMRFSLDLRYNTTGYPTGRALLPGFVARSRSDPASEHHSPEQWLAVWKQTQQDIMRVVADLEQGKGFDEEDAFSRHAKDSLAKEEAIEDGKLRPGFILGRARWSNDPDAQLCA